MSNSLGTARAPHEDIWNESLEIIRENINPRSYQTWFAPLESVSLTDTTIILRVPNKFFCEWLDNHYLSLLQNAIAQVAGHSLAIQYEIKENQNYTSPYAGKKFEATDLQTTSTSNRLETNLNNHYTFENFIVGDGTRFAQAAAIAVSDAPGSTNYNPLIIYGGTGLGKTHLIQAIGNQVRLRRPDLKVFYTSSESFTSHFISSIQQNKAIEFSGFYRSCDLLLIDDIQFFNNKGKTQEEFLEKNKELFQAYLDA